MLLLKESLINLYNGMAQRSFGHSQLVFNIKEDIALLESPSATNRDIMNIKAALKKTLLDLVMYGYSQLWPARDSQHSDIDHFFDKISEESDQLLEKLKQVCRSDIFVYCDTLNQDKSTLKSICQEVLAIFTLRDVQPQLREGVIQYFNRFDENVRDKELSSIKMVTNTIAKKLFKNRSSMMQEVIEEDDSQKMDINDSELVHLLSEFYHGAPPKGHQEQFG